MMHRLRCARVHSALAFPVMRLRASELQVLQPGTLLCLPLVQGTPAELRVGGESVFRAEPVRAGEHRAAHIVHAVEETHNGGHRG